ncbi:hypothetical protein DXG01_004078 [Tephrocybe rancida]|nr:hypothetical protein DXG01_004078 [Tephrocybe rancida]
MKVEVWRHDPVAVIKELIESPLIGGKNQYTPCRVYQDEKCKNHEYGEMNEGDWVWETQEKLLEGATVVPVILSSDKTSLMLFSGDKQAYPVYLAIGTTDHKVRRQTSAHAMVLIGYIPVTKLECFSKARQAVEGYQLFHNSMEAILEPLINAGKNGVIMTCADGMERRVYPILAAYVADYPEQCLVVGCQENSCPTCTMDPKQRGDPVHSVLRDPDKTLTILAQQACGDDPPKFAKQCLWPINPFWRDLPHCNIFQSITPNLLHQLHKGVFKDHTVSWASKAVPGGTDEVD